MSDPVALYDAWRAGAMHRLPDGFWRVEGHARAVLEALWEREGIAPEDVPHRCRSRWFRQNGLSTLLYGVYRGSPYLLLTSLYPGRWNPGDFPEFPKAKDLQRDAFAREGLTWDPDDGPRRWAQTKRARNVRQGRCILCQRPADGRLCAYHREHMRRYGRQRYRESRDAGLCYRCRTRPAVKCGACWPCYQRILVVQARAARRHYWANRERGLCGRRRCNEPAVPGTAFCARHHADQRDRYYRLHYREKARQYRARRKAAQQEALSWNAPSQTAGESPSDRGHQAGGGPDTWSSTGGGS